VANQNLAQLTQASASAVVIPITAKKPRPAGANRSQMAFLTPEETLAVLKAARSRSSRDWPMALPMLAHSWHVRTRICRSQSDG